MILKNNTPKGRVYTIIVNGYPVKVRVGAYGQYDLSKIDKRFETDGLDGVDISSRKNKKFGVVFNSHTFSLISNTEKGKSFVNFKPEDVISEVSSDPSSEWDYEGVLTVGTDDKGGFGYIYGGFEDYGSVTPDTYISSAHILFKMCTWADRDQVVFSTGNIHTIQIGELTLTNGVHIFTEEEDMTVFACTENPFPEVGQTVNVKYILN